MAPKIREKEKNQRKLMRDHSSPNSLFFNCYVKDFLCTSELGKAGENKKTSHLISEGSSSCSANAFSPFFQLMLAWISHFIVHIENIRESVDRHRSPIQREMGESWNNKWRKTKNWITQKKVSGCKSKLRVDFQGHRDYLLFYCVSRVSRCFFFRIYFFSFFFFKLFFFSSYHRRICTNVCTTFRLVWSVWKTYGQVADPSHSELTCS